MTRLGGPAASAINIRRVQRFAKERGRATFDEIALSTDIVTVSGILLTQKTIGKAGKIFASLTDGRDEVQLIIPLDGKGVAAEKTKTLGRGARVTVSGSPFLAGRSTTEPTPSLFVRSIHESVLPAPTTFDQSELRREVTPGLVIGVLMSAVSTAFEELEYARYEPRVISSSISDPLTQPLSVRFAGRGVDLSLEVSPLPQLLYAAIMTGRLRLYSQTRLFSRAYRDGYTSSASPIVAAVAVDLNTASQTDASNLVTEVIRHISTVPAFGLPLDLPATMEAGESSNDTVQIRRVPLAEPRSSEFAYDIREQVFADVGPGHTIIEGHEGCIAGAIHYVWICVHVERLAAGDFWRIRGRKGPSTEASN